jgi:glycine cleavage system H protein
MSAGLIAYKLCDRDFDCDGCPLDAALRGGASWAGESRSGAASAPRAPVTFPAGIRYSDAHSWVRPESAGTARIGIDGFAARLVGTPRAVHAVPAGKTLSRGDPLCIVGLEGGSLSVKSPLAGRIGSVNGRLEREPGLLTSDPYGTGWIATLVSPAAPDSEALVDSDQAAALAELDLRRFRRLAAMRMLSAAPRLGPSLADGGARIWDIRAMLGPGSYVEVLRDLLG